MERTMLHVHLIKIRFQYQKVDNWKFIMESQNLLLGGTKDDGTKLLCIRTNVERKASSNTSCWCCLSVVENSLLFWGKKDFQSHIKATMMI